ncbi:MAG: DUF1905 domain-containing protein [Hyphomicrobiaceae bacterium]|nr:DUF1905 domain-containing protein [Hyphomicrobiaceae bacterium]MCC0023660.1 DUF1905 domain-containing protein [Hyphomicrobiaceae bacterium]
MKFTATIKPTGNNTGIVVPPEVLDQLGGGRRPRVRVTLNGFTFSLSLGSMGDDVMIPISAERRKLANVAANEVHEVEIVLDDAPEQIAVPDDFASALKAAGLSTAFENLAPSHRKEHVRAIVEAKKPETRQRRIEKAIEMIAADKKAL